MMSFFQTLLLRWSMRCLDDDAAFSLLSEQRLRGIHYVENDVFLPNIEI